MRKDNAKLIPFKFLQWLLIVGVFSAPCAWASEQEPSFELGRYIGAVRSGQNMVYRLLGYCAQEVPDKKEQIENAKAQWDSRNLLMVNSVKEVASGWFLAAGIPPESISELLAVIDPSIAAAVGTVRVEEKAVAELAALEPEERKKRCGFYTGFVIGGGLDIQTLFPKANDFYRKYAPANP